MPSVASDFVSPSKDASAAISSHVPEPSPPKIHKKDISKPEGIAIHSRCCCRRHTQQSEQKTTLKSRSSDSFKKEVN